MYSLLEPIAEHVGWEPKEGEGQTTTLLRPLVLGFAGKVGNKSIIAEAKKRFNDQVCLSCDSRDFALLGFLSPSDIHV